MDYDLIVTYSSSYWFWLQSEPYEIPYLISSSTHNLIFYYQNTQENSFLGMSRM